jgi:hypothetical protein
MRARHINNISLGEWNRDKEEPVLPTFSHDKQNFRHSKITQNYQSVMQQPLRRENKMSEALLFVCLDLHHFPMLLTMLFYHFIIFTTENILSLKYNSTVK